MNDEIYRSADFPTICSLYHLRFQPEQFDRDPRSPGKITVTFKRTTGLDETLRALRNRELSVEPIAFLETTREVRGRLRDCA